MFLARVTELIESRGITKNKLLLEVGLNTNAFNNWEKRGTIPSGETLSKIADYFHVSTDYLLGRTDNKEPPETGGKPLRSALLDNFEQLNQEGQERLAETSDDMVSSGKYKKSGEGCKKPDAAKLYVAARDGSRLEVKPSDRLTLPEQNAEIPE